ncbi:MAG: hypothetical protein WCQ72_01590 [Eubacteriales bacterium]
MTLSAEKEHELCGRLMLAAIRGLCGEGYITREEGRVAAGKIIRGLTGDFSSDIIYYDKNHYNDKEKYVENG